MSTILLTYYLEREAVQRAHKKFKAHGTNWAAKIHGMFSCVELAVGLAAVLHPERPEYAKATAWIALGINLPTGWLMTPRVFGVKHLTVPGFSLMGVMRTVEAYRVLKLDTRLVPNLWILLHVGTVVRLLGYHILPYSTTDGPRGDLFTGTRGTQPPLPSFLPSSPPPSPPTLLSPPALCSPLLPSLTSALLQHHCLADPINYSFIILMSGEQPVSQ